MKDKVDDLKKYHREGEPEIIPIPDVNNIFMGCVMDGTVKVIGSYAQKFTMEFMTPFGPTDVELRVGWKHGDGFYIEPVDDRVYNTRKNKEGG